MNNRIFHKLLIGVLLSSCQSIKDSSLEGVSMADQIPTHLRVFFSSCVGDGALISKLSKDGEVFLQAETEWIVGDEQVVTLGFLDPVGREQKRIVLSKKSDSKGAEKEMISVNEKDWLSFYGHEIRLKPLELACLFKGKFPQGWLSRLSRVNNEQKSLFSLSDGARLILVDFSEFLMYQKTKPVPSDSRHHSGQIIKASVGWGGFLGLFKKELKLLMRYQNSLFLEGSLEISDYMIDWQPIFEG